MAKPTKLTKAIAYLRTSSAANIGSDKDSDKRQRAAIEAFAKRAGFLCAVVRISQQPALREDHRVRMRAQQARSICASFHRLNLAGPNELSIDPDFL